MIFDLFAEDEEPQFGEDAAGKEVGAAARGTNRPEASRPPCRLAGLKNLGTTCYLNSLIQTMFFTPGFRERLYTLTPEDLKPRSRSIPRELQRLFAEMSVLDQGSMTTASLTSSFGWSNSDQVVQHDVQELNRILFNAIGESLAGSACDDLIQSLYRGSFANLIICESCNRVSRRDEEFLDLTLPLTGLHNLEESLASFTEMEHLTGDNQYRCDNCSKLVDARKGIRLSRLPPVLTLSLNRFRYDWQRMVRIKENGKFTFPATLSMKPYCDVEAAQDRPDAEFQYDLYSVVIHSGAAHGGHYHAYIRDVYDEGEWQEAEVREVELKRQKADQDRLRKKEINALEHDNPGSLLREILGKLSLSREKVLINDLAKGFKDETGSAWNRVCKRKHGTFRNFLKGNPAFIICDPYVSLDPAAPAEAELGAAAGSPDTTKTAQSAATAATGGKPSAATPAPGEAAGETPARPPTRWFDLNDSSVTSITERSIANQFQGRESAYMLFYARRGVLDSCRGQGPQLPPWLHAELASANQQLAEQRAEYDRLVNRLELQVCPPSQLRSDGYLLVPQATDGQAGLEPRTFEVDRRMPLADFQQQVHGALGLDPEPHTLVFHTLEEYAPGQHFLGSSFLPPLSHPRQTEEAKGCSSSDHGHNNVPPAPVPPAPTLFDCGFRSGSLLLAWDGASVGGGGQGQIVPGQQNRPMTVNVMFMHAEDGTHREFAVVLPKSRCLSEVHAEVARLAGQDAATFSLHRLDKAVWGKAQSHVQAFAADQLTRTLDKLGLKDGTKLVASASQGQIEAMKQEARRFQATLSVTLIDATREGFPVCSIAADRTSTLAAFHAKVAAELDLGAAPFRLRIRKQVGSVAASDAGELLLHLDRKLAGFGFTADTIVVAEPGATPDVRKTLVVLVEPGVKARARLRAAATAAAADGADGAGGGGDQTDAFAKREFELDPQVAVGDALVLVRDAFGFDGPSWHLCTSNSFGEIDQHLSEPHVALGDLKINQNDLLILEEGEVLPKGHAEVQVYVNKHAAAGTTHLPDWVLARLALFAPEGAVGAAVGATVGTGSSPAAGEAVEAGGAAAAGGLVLASEQAFLSDDLEHVGKVVVDVNNTTMEIFKEKLLGLAFFDGCAVSHDCVRVQQVNRGRLRNVLRIQGKGGLKKHLNREARVAVSVLPVPDPLTPGSILLNVTRRVPAVANCTPLRPMVFEAGMAPSLGDLRAACATFLGLPSLGDDLILAKRQLDSFRWTVLKPGMVSQKKKGGKRKGKGKRPNVENLREQPYQIRDGDIIAVRAQTDDPEGKDDWMTDLDRKLQLVEAEEIDEKRRTRKGRKARAGGHWAESSRRPEVALRITVAQDDDEGGGEPRS